MGKTVPSYRMALEMEIALWKPFRNALESEAAKVAFDEVMDMCRGNAMAAGNACKPILFEPMTMSILLGQQKRILELEAQLKKYKGDAPSQAAKPQNMPQSASVVLSRGIKLSKINQALKGSLDVVVLLGKLQQQGWIRIV